MKINRITAFILALSMINIPILNTNNAFADVSDSSKYGYIFTTKKDLTDKIQLMDADINIVSEENNIYYSKTIEEIEKLGEYKTITHIAEDMPIELFDDFDTPNDSLYSLQWYMEACNIPEILKHNVTGQGVKIGVIDTGIYAEHEDFADLNIKDGINACAILDENENNLYNYNDANGHGTAVTSIIAANTNNNKGVAGIAYNSTIIPICIYDSNSQRNLSVSSMLAGMEYAGNMGCDVINLSLGFSNPSNELLNITNELIDSLTDKGILIIAASGNKGASTNVIEYPAMCDKVIGVGAIEKTDDEYDYASYSTANHSVFISAPGSSIASASISSPSAYSYKSGTSFAVPIVSAFAADVKQIYPDINISEFKELLLKCSTDINEENYDIYTGYGMIDFTNLYLEANQLKPQPTDTPEPTDKPIETIEPLHAIEPTQKPDTDIYSDILYYETTNQFEFILHNYTDEYIDVTCIIAIYDQNNTLIKAETFNGLEVGKIIKTVEYDNSYGTAKVLIWDSLESIKPYESYLSSIWISPKIQEYE